MKRFGSNVNLGFAQAADVHLAVPAVPQTIKEIMKRFPLSWERASNCAYFIPTTGDGLGTIWEGGIKYQDQPEAWPTLVQKNGAFTLRESGGISFADAGFAMAAGPIIVRDGLVTDIGKEIAEKGFTGFSDGVPKAQTAVGLRPDGLLVHVVAASLTLTQLAQVMRELGCHTAMKMDGGGSATLYRHDGTQAVREFGSDTRKFPCALVLRREAAAPPDLAMSVPGRGRSLMGSALATTSQMEDLCHSVNPEAPYYADLYLSTGARMGIRGDLAYAQALQETDYFRYGGLVSPWQNNFGGLGATGPGQPGEVFASAAEGVLAQVQHLHAYATARPLPSGLLMADTRYDLVSRGSAATLDSLSGSWANDSGYGSKINAIYEQILTLPVRPVGKGEQAGWAAANSRIAAGAHADRVAAGASVVESHRKGRTWSGIVVLKQAVPAWTAPGGGASSGTLPPGSCYPSFRTDLTGDWHQITMLDGSAAWVEAAGLTAVPSPETPPGEPTAAIVVIDPGHGGADTGAVGPNGLREKEVNLAISLALKDRLAAYAGRVWLTRSTDTDASLTYRADLATASGGNLFLSVHNNALSSTSRGTETYFQCGYEQSQATIDASRRFGCLVQTHLLNCLDRHNEGCGNCCPTFDRGTICRLRSRDDLKDYYYVLRAAFIPAALVEGLFLSNPQEEACLAQSEVQEAIADALYQAVVDWLAGVSAGCDFKTFYGL